MLPGRCSLKLGVASAVNREAHVAFTWNAWVPAGVNGYASRELARSRTAEPLARTKYRLLLNRCCDCSAAHGQIPGPVKNSRTSVPASWP